VRESSGSVPRRCILSSPVDSGVPSGVVAGIPNFISSSLLDRVDEESVDSSSGRRRRK
jgi:hypothetical protein